MKIAEFAVLRYGPLRETGVVRPAGFTLFFAPNEEGKTLLVEALARMLLQKEARAIAGIDRVDENPEGHLVLETPDGEHKLPEDGSVLDLCDLRPMHWRNVFVIRNSDLVLPQESGLYSSVADRLTGLKTRDIEAVCDRLRDIAMLTPTDLRISDAQEHGKLKTRLERARGLRKEIGRLHEEVESRALAEVERELVQASEEIERIDGELQALEEARKRDTYHACSRALHDLRKSLHAAEQLKDYSADELDEWEAQEQKASKAADQVKRLQSELQRLRQTIEELEARHAEKGRELQVLKRRADDAEELQLQMREHDRSVQALRSLGPAEHFLKRAGLVLALLTALALGASLAVHTAWALALAGLFGLPALACGIVALRNALRRGRADAQLAALRRRAAQIALKGETTEEIRRAIRCLDDEREKTSLAVQQLTADCRVAREKLEQITETQLPQAREKLESARRAIADIRTRSGLSGPAQYRERVLERERHLESVRTHAAVLESRLGSAAERPEDNLGHWEDKLRPLAQHAESVSAVEYSEHRVQELQRKRRELVNRRGELQRALEGLRKKLEEVARRANEILRLEDDYLHCQTLRDLETIQDRLAAFVERHESRAELAREAIAIFEQINRQEEDKVAELFGPESAVSHLLAEITDGLYEAVLYERGEDGGRRVCVRAEDGTVLDARRLSGGAYDQLYLAVRLALGEALLGEQKGFFIMDDPFVKADADRLRRQVELLNRIVQRGWQVLYLTAKEEVRRALEPQIQQGLVQQLPVPGVRRGA